MRSLQPIPVTDPRQWKWSLPQILHLQQRKWFPPQSLHSAPQPIRLLLRQSLHSAPQSIRLLLRQSLHLVPQPIRPVLRQSLHSAPQPRIWLPPQELQTCRQFPPRSPHPVLLPPQELQTCRQFPPRSPHPVPLLQRRLPPRELQAGRRFPPKSPHPVTLPQRRFTLQSLHGRSDEYRVPVVQARLCWNSDRQGETILRPLPGTERLMCQGIPETGRHIITTVTSLLHEDTGDGDSK